MWSCGLSIGCIHLRISRSRGRGVHAPPSRPESSLFLAPGGSAEDRPEAPRSSPVRAPALEIVTESYLAPPGDHPHAQPRERAGARRPATPWCTRDGSHPLRAASSRVLRRHLPRLPSRRRCRVAAGPRRCSGAHDARGRPAAGSPAAPRVAPSAPASSRSPHCSSRAFVHRGRHRAGERARRVRRIRDGRHLDSWPQPSRCPARWSRS